MAKVSFKESSQTTQNIIAAAKKGDAKPIYLLMGEEGYFIDRVETFLTENLLDQAARDFNLQIFYGKDSTAEDVVMACRRYPMMSERQVIVVREAQTLPNIALLETYAEKPSPTTVLIICHKTKALDKRSTLYKSLAAVATILESVAPRDYELETFIENTLKEKNAAADRKAIAMLAEFIGTNISKINGEIDKLLTAIPATAERKITPELVEKFVGVSKEYNVFELTKALSARNFGAALRIADYFAQNPKNNPFVLTMGMLFNHFQRIVIVGLMQWEARKPGGRAPSESDIARKLGVQPFFVSEYVTAARNYPTRVAFEIIGLLREYDMKSKGIGVGTVADGELLKELLLRISLL